MAGPQRSKLGDIVESGASHLPETIEVTKGLKNVVGWLKQVLDIILMHFNRCCFCSTLITCLVFTRTIRFRIVLVD